MALSCATPQVVTSRARQTADKASRAFEAGRLADADILLRTALDLFRKEGNAKATAHTLLQLARIARRQGKSVVAVGLAGEALAVYRQIDDRTGCANSYMEMGGAREDLGNFVAAREEYLWAIAFARATNDVLREALARAALAAVSAIVAEVQQARNEIAKARSLMTGLPEFAAARISAALGRAMVELGDLASAVALFDEASVVFGTHANPYEEHVSVLDAARAAAEAGDAEGALTRYRRAVDLLKTMNAPGTAAAAMFEAAVAFERAGKTDEAMHSAEEAILRYQTAKSEEGVARARLIHTRAWLASGNLNTGSPKLTDLAQALAQDAKTLHVLGEPVDEAEAYLLLGLVFLQLPDVSSAAGAFGQAIELASSVAAFDITFAASALLGRLAEERLDREDEAARFYEAAVRTIRRSAAIEFNLEGWSHFTGNVFVRLAKLRVLQARRSGDLAYLDGARAAFEAAQAQAFVASLEQAGAVLADDDIVRRRARALAGTERAILRRLRWAGEPAGYRRPLLENLERAHAERIELEAGSRRWSFARPEAVTFETVRSVLKPEEVFLEFLLGDQGSLLLVTRQSAQDVIDLPPREELQSALRSWSKARAQSTPDAGRHEARALWNLLLKPAVDRGLLDGAKLLVVVPDGLLAALPVGALEDSAGVPVADRHTVVYAPSAATWFRWRQPREPKKGIATLVAFQGAERQAEAAALAANPACGDVVLSGVTAEQLRAQDLRVFRTLHLLAPVELPKNTSVGTQPRIGRLSVAQMIDLDLVIPEVSFGPVVVLDDALAMGLRVLVRALVTAGAIRVAVRMGGGLNDIMVWGAE